MTNRPKNYSVYLSNLNQRYQIDNEFRERRKAYSSKWRKNNPEKAKELNSINNKKRKILKDSPETWARGIIYSIKDKCKKQNIKFDLVESDLIVPTICPALNVPLDFKNKNKWSDYAPSVDRIIPSKGYIKGNVKVISQKANRLKSNSTNPSELRAVANYLEQSLKGLVS